MADPAPYTPEWCDPGYQDGVDCNGFLTCMGPTAVWTISLYFLSIIVLLVGTLAFLKMNQKQQGPNRKALEKRLTFHSTDDAPRDFNQAGYKFSPVGALLLYSWVVLFGVGYLYVMMASFLVYAPTGFLLFVDSWPTWMNLFFRPCATGSGSTFSGGKHGWSSFMGVYCMVITGTHILWLVLSMVWETMRVGLMTPMPTLGEGATHVLIEEQLSFDTDDDLVDPDAGVIGKLEASFRNCTKMFAASATRTVVQIDTAKDGTKSIEYTCVRYAFDSSMERFRPKGIVEYNAMELHKLIEDGGLAEQAAAEQQRECGKNEIKVHVPGILEALVSEFSDFTYAFNSVGTWSYLIYSSWNIGVFWLAMTVSSGAYRALGIVRPNQQKIATLAQLRGKATVLRGGSWKQTEISEIVLGDVVRIEGNSAKLPCDGVVVQGSLVVNESMLTGEPMPIQKMPVEKSENSAITKKNVAYSGTECMQSIGPSDGYAVMVATSVGALTTRGQLVRMVLFPTSVRFRYNDQMPLVYAFIFVYMIGLCSIYMSPLMDLGDWIAKYMMLLNTVAMCLSPMLPVSLVMGQATAASRLTKDHEINCLQPGRIPIAGKMSTIVFDKTGTITKDGMDFDSVIPAEASKFGTPIKIDVDNPKANPGKIEKEVPKLLRYALASCHTVTTLPDGTLVGNAVECAMVAAVGWKIFEDKVTSPSGAETLPLAKKLDFDHKRMTSGIVVKSDTEFIVYIKGSYEKIQSISKPEAVPADYGATTEKCAKDGYYVLGIATKTIPLSEEAKLVDMTRDQIEEGLSVCGLLLFRNEMKKDSPQAILELKEGGIRSVICTGDNALTGISIGRQCHIVTTEKILLGEKTEEGHITWRDPDSEQTNVDIWAGEFAGRDLAVTQGAWRRLHSNQKELEAIWTRLKVFARMKPEDKINVVKYFQSRGLIVGMAGDGGNDCGGLRAAHAGLALSDAEASMVSPFSTGRDGKSLLTMVDVVREGRACLATNMGTFTYFMVYCFVLTMIRTIIGVRAALSFGEFVWFLNDVGINIFLVGAMTVSGPCEKLGKYRPTATLLGPRTLAGIAYPIISCMVLYLITAYVFLFSQDFYTTTGGIFHPINDISLPSAAWMLRGDNFHSPVAWSFMFLTLITTAFVNTYGGEFRASVIMNRSMSILYVLLVSFITFVIWTPPNAVNCMFRVSCDTEASFGSAALAENWLPFGWFWKVAKAFSVGTVGDCFMGPQIQVWQDEFQTWFIDSTGGDSSFFELQPLSDPLPNTPPAGNETPATVPKAWVSEKARGECYPYWMAEMDGVRTQWAHPDQSTGPLVFTPQDDPTIDGTAGCKGPNNCYPFSFKVTFSAMLLLHVVGQHVYVKYVLHGSFVEKFRKQKEIELQQSSGSPLLAS